MSHVLAEVCTRGRYHTTLPLTLQALAHQTRPPDALLLVDDNPQPIDLMTDPVLGQVLSMAARVFPVRVVPGCGAPHLNHETARTHEWARELVWRVDDDEVPEPDVLGNLLPHIESFPDVGAVGGAVLQPGAGANPHASSALEDIHHCLNVQWYGWPQGTVFENVGHLHSSYLYRKDAAPYPSDLSPVSHTEETQHTVRIRLGGERLVVDGTTVTWHYKQASGGIRTAARAEWFREDEQKFKIWLGKQGVSWRRRLAVVTAQGIGDAFCCLGVLPGVLQSWRGFLHEALVFVRADLLGVFRTHLSTVDVGFPVRVFPNEDTALWYLPGEHNIYNWMGRVGFQGRMEEAVRARYSKEVAVEEDCLAPLA